MVAIGLAIVVMVALGGGLGLFGVATVGVGAPLLSGRTWVPPRTAYAVVPLIAALAAATPFLALTGSAGRSWAIFLLGAALGSYGVVYIVRFAARSTAGSNAKLDRPRADR